MSQFFSESPPLSPAQEMKGSLFAVLEHQKSGRHAAFIMHEIFRFEDALSGAKPEEEEDVRAFYRHLQERPETRLQA